MAGVPAPSAASKPADPRSPAAEHHVRAGAERRQRVQRVLAYAGGRPEDASGEPAALAVPAELLEPHLRRVSSSAGTIDARNDVGLGVVGAAPGPARPASAVGDLVVVDQGEDLARRGRDAALRARDRPGSARADIVRPAAAAANSATTSAVAWLTGALSTTSARPGSASGEQAVQAGGAAPGRISRVQTTTVIGGRVARAPRAPAGQEAPASGPTRQVGRRPASGRRPRAAMRRGRDLRASVGPDRRGDRSGATPPAREPVRVGRPGISRSQPDEQPLCCGRPRAAAMPASGCGQLDVAHPGAG